VYRRSYNAPMIKTLIRGVCWFLIYGGSVVLIGLIGTWTGVIEFDAHVQLFETRWRYQDPGDAFKILAMAFAMLIVGGLGIRFVPRRRPSLSALMRELRQPIPK
jgi:hypothetical protein